MKTLIRINQEVTLVNWPLLDIGDKKIDMIRINNI